MLNLSSKIATLVLVFFGQLAFATNTIKVDYFAGGFTVNKVRVGIAKTGKEFSAYIFDANKSDLLEQRPISVSIDDGKAGFQGSFEYSGEKYELYINPIVQRPTAVQVNGTAVSFQAISADQGMSLNIEGSENLKYEAERARLAAERAKQPPRPERAEPVQPEGQRPSLADIFGTSHTGIRDVSPEVERFRGGFQLNDVRLAAVDVDGRSLVYIFDQNNLLHGIRPLKVSMNDGKAGFQGSFEISGFKYEFRLSPFHTIGGLEVNGVALSTVEDQFTEAKALGLKIVKPAPMSQAKPAILEPATTITKARAGVLDRCADALSNAMKTVSRILSRGK